MIRHVKFYLLKRVKFGSKTAARMLATTRKIQNSHWLIKFSLKRPTLLKTVKVPPSSILSLRGGADCGNPWLVSDQYIKIMPFLRAKMDKYLSKVSNEAIFHCLH